VTKKINLRNQLVFQKSLTWPDVLSSVCQTGPLCTSDSTGTVTEPRIVLFHTMSQSYIVTFIYGSVENENMGTREMLKKPRHTAFYGNRIIGRRHKCIKTMEKHPGLALHELMNSQQFCQD
jgi:hypothetical protein